MFCLSPTSCERPAWPLVPNAGIYLLYHIHIEAICILCLDVTNNKCDFEFISSSLSNLSFRKSASIFVAHCLRSLICPLLFINSLLFWQHRLRKENQHFRYQTPQCTINICKLECYTWQSFHHLLLLAVTVEPSDYKDNAIIFLW